MSGSVIRAMLASPGWPGHRDTLRGRGLKSKHKRPMWREGKSWATETSSLHPCDLHLHGFTILWASGPTGDLSVRQKFLKDLPTLHQQFVPEDSLNPLPPTPCLSGPPVLHWCSVPSTVLIRLPHRHPYPKETSSPWWRHLAPLHPDVPGLCGGGIVPSQVSGNLSLVQWTQGLDATRRAGIQQSLQKTLRIRWRWAEFCLPVCQSATGLRSELEG